MSFAKPWVVPTWATQWHVHGSLPYSPHANRFLARPQLARKAIYIRKTQRWPSQCPAMGSCCRGWQAYGMGCSLPVPSCNFKNTNTCFNPPPPKLREFQFLGSRCLRNRSVNSVMQITKGPGAQEDSGGSQRNSQHLYIPSESAHN